MARRYGRNQKRRHREQIANLEARVAELTESERLAKLIAVDADAKTRAIIARVQSVTPNSVVLSPVKRKHPPYSWEIPELFEPVTIRMHEPLTARSMLRDCAHTTVRVELGKVMAWIDSVVKTPDFRTRIHFQCPSPDGEGRAGHYWISNECGDMRSLDVQSRVAQHVVDVIRAEYETAENEKVAKEIEDEYDRQDRIWGRG